MVDATELEALRQRLAQAEAKLQVHAEVEAELRESLEKYRSVFDAIDEGFCIIEVLFDAHGKAVDLLHLEANEAYERYTGLRNIVGKRALEILPEGGPWLDFYASVARTGEPARLETYLEPGVDRWIASYASRVGGPGSRKVAVVFNDVTARKRTELELLRSNELLRTTFDNSLQIVQLFEAVRGEQNEIVDFEWLLTNKQWNDRWGPMLGRRLLEANPAVVESGVWDKFLKVIETGDPITHEHYYAHEQFDGWFLQTIAKADDGILLSTLDITDRKRSEIALRESEERLGLAIEIGELASWDWDLRSGVVTWNDRHFLLQGYASGEITPSFEAWLKRVHPQDREETLARIKKARDDKQIYAHEFRNVHTDGSIVWCSARGRFFYDERGEPYRMIGVMEDVTIRRRAEDLLRASEERQAFLLTLSDALRAEQSAAGIAERGVRLLGEKLKLDRCYLSNIFPEEDRELVTQQFATVQLELLPRELRLSSAPASVRGRTEKTLVIGDSASHPGLTEGERKALTALHFEALICVPLRQGASTSLWILAAISQQCRVWTAAEVTLVEETAERIWVAMERANAESALQESEARFRQFANASAAGLWIRDAATLKMEFVSPAISTMYGIEPEHVLGELENWAKLIVPEDRSAAIENVEAARRGKSEVHEFRIQRPSDGSFRWIRDSHFPLHASGRVHRIGGIAEDVTESKLAVEHQSVLLAELQHRVRNIMAIMRSIVIRTAATGGTVEDYVELLSGRLLTLARVQTLLTRAPNASVSLRTIVEEELAAHSPRPDQLDLGGPNVSLSPKAAEAMTLAVHELTTNALKYGALSAESGRIVVRWSVVEIRDAPWLTFDWRETGVDVPVASSSPRSGFGSDLIEGRVPYELGGQASLRIEPEGAHCHLEFPLTDGASVLETDAPKRTTLFGGTLDMSGEANLTGERVLVVEDDHYLASDTAGALRGAGAVVVGPCATEAMAREQIAKTPVTCALLDINLHGGRSFGLALELQKSGIPFLFITGYDQEVIPEELANVPRLQKPVQFKEIIRAVATALGSSRSVAIQLT